MVNNRPLRPTPVYRQQPALPTAPAATPLNAAATGPGAETPPSHPLAAMGRMLDAGAAVNRHLGGAASTTGEKSAFRPVQRGAAQASLAGTAGPAGQAASTSAEPSPLTSARVRRPTSGPDLRAYNCAAASRHRVRKRLQASTFEARLDQAAKDNVVLKQKVGAMETVVGLMRYAALHLMLGQPQAPSNAQHDSTQTDPSPPPKPARKAGAPWNPAFD